MKKIIGLVLIALIALVALSACGDKDDQLVIGTVRIGVPSGYTAFNVPLNTQLVAVYEGGTIKKADVTYQWNRDEAAISGKTTTSFTPDVPGRYNVTVTAKDKSASSNYIIVVGDGLTFIDDLGVKEFTIYDDLRFNVEYFDNNFDKQDEDVLEILNGFDIAPGFYCTGKVKETENEWLDIEITGKAQELESNIEALNDILAGVVVAIKLTYTKGAGDNIEKIYVDFPEKDIEDGSIRYDYPSSKMLGGSYNRKN